MEKETIEKLINYKSQLGFIMDKLHDENYSEILNGGKLFYKSIKSKKIQSDEFKQIQFNVYEIHTELAKLLQDSYFKAPQKVFKRNTPDQLIDMLMEMSCEIKDTLDNDPEFKKIKKRKSELFYKINSGEIQTEEQIKHQLINIMHFNQNPELLKNFLSLLKLNNIIKCDIDKALCLLDEIVFIGEVPEKDVTAFMRFLEEKKMITIDNNKTIHLCFKRETGEWDNDKLYNYRNKLKSNEIKNHIRRILE
jgi:hypothetical protein